MVFHQLVQYLKGGVKFVSDDIIIYSKTIEEHYEIIRKLFDRIWDSGLSLNYEKYLFLQNKLKFFAVILSSAGVKPEPQKTVVLREVLPLSNISELCSFLGLCAHLSRFISNFSAKTASLRALLKKNENFIWAKEQDLAFENLKQELTDESMLAFYDPNKTCMYVINRCM